MDFSSLLWARAPLNAASFAFREWLGWRRGMPRLLGQSWQSAQSHWPREKRHSLMNQAREYRESFRLADFDSVLNSRQWMKNLYVLDLLIHTLQPHLDLARSNEAVASEPVRVLDTGCADWDYVFALHRFFRKAFPGGMELTGLEIDGHGIYPDGYSRADYTSAYIQALQDPGVSVQYGDASRMDFPPQDVLTCFFPFILPYQILAWGLPLKLLKPLQFLKRQAAWVRPGGLWFLVSHAQEEREPMRAILAGMQEFDLLDEGPARSGFEDEPSSYDERWYWIFRKRSG